MQKFLGLTVCLSAVISFVPTVAFSLPLSGQTLDLLQKCFLQEGKRVKVKGEGDNTELFPLPPAPYPQRGPHLPLFPTYARSLLNNLVEKAKLEVSKTTGISANTLTVVNKATLADTGIMQFKLRDTQGNIYGVSLDAAGNQISQKVLEQAIQAINNKGFVGKLETELVNRIAQGSNSPIKVIFHLKGETVQPYQGSNRTEHQNHLNTLKSHYQVIQQPLVNQLKESNQRVIYQSLYTPIVVAEVTPLLIQTIAARSDVERIYLARRTIRR